MNEREGRKKTWYYTKAIIASARQGTFHQSRVATDAFIIWTMRYLFGGVNKKLPKYRLAEPSHHPLKYVVDLSN